MQYGAMLSGYEKSQYPLPAWRRPPSRRGCAPDRDLPWSTYPLPPRAVPSSVRPEPEQVARDLQYSMVAYNRGAYGCRPLHGLERLHLHLRGQGKRDRLLGIYEKSCLEDIPTLPVATRGGNIRIPAELLSRWALSGRGVHGQPARHNATR